MTTRKTIRSSQERCNGCPGCVTASAGGAQGPVDGVLLDSYRGRLTLAMVDQFGNDTRRINHALSVLSYADRIQDVEGGDVLVVTAAALLHDIGIQEAERIYGSSAPRYQEELGPPIARSIMEDLAIDGAVIDHVTRIVGSHHSARDIDTIEFCIIWDADLLVNLRDEGPSRPPEQWEKTIEKVFRTGAGKRLASRVLIEP